MKFDFTAQIKQKTNEELIEIFKHPKDYNPDFVALAEIEIVNRNINIDDAKQERLKFEQVNKTIIYEGKPGNPLYIFISFILALFGGLLGAYAGYIYNQSKTIDSNGIAHYVYNEQTRKTGGLIMWLGIIVILIYLLVFSFK